MFVRKSTFDAVVAELETELEITDNLSSIIREQDLRIQKLEASREKSNANLKQYRKEAK